MTRLIGVASSPIACAMRTSRPSPTDHAASIDRSRSRRASSFWRGITVVSFGCQTWTSGSSSGIRARGDDAPRAIDAVARTPWRATARRRRRPTRRLPTTAARGIGRREAPPAASDGFERLHRAGVTTSGHTSSVCVGPSRPLPSADRSAASDVDSLRQPDPSRCDADESSVRSTPVAVS